MILHLLEEVHRASAQTPDPSRETLPDLALRGEFCLAEKADLEAPDAVDEWRRKAMLLSETRDAWPPPGASALLTCQSATASQETNGCEQGQDTDVADCEDWLPGLLQILERQADPNEVAPTVRVDVLAILFELYWNPGTKHTIV